MDRTAQKKKLPILCIILDDQKSCELSQGPKGVLTPQKDLITEEPGTQKCTSY